MSSSTLNQEEKELVEEPQSGCLVPAVLTSGSGRLLALVATGLRVKRIAFVDVQVYVLSIYASPAELPKASELLDPTVLRDSPAEKVLCLTFLRSVSAKQVTDALNESFENVAETVVVPQEAVQDAAAQLPGSICKGTQIHFTVRPSQGQVEIHVISAPSGSSSSADGCSGGAVLHQPELCRGVQEIFLGRAPIVRGLHDSLQQRLIELPACARAYSASCSDFDDASEDVDSCSTNSRSPEKDREALAAATAAAAPPVLPTIASGGELASLAAREELEEDPQLAAELPSTPQEQRSQEMAPEAAIAMAADDAAANEEEEEFADSSFSVTADSFQRQSSGSWKERAKRQSGKEGYKFGDFTRTLMQKARSGRMSASSAGSLDKDDASPGGQRHDCADMGPAGQPEETRGSLPLTLEGEDTAWAAPCAVVLELDAAGLSALSLRAELYKEHTSAVRGRLVPRWTLRHFELEAGVVGYRKRQGGSVRGAFSLEGARVVAEPPKQSPRGECFVFRVEWGRGPGLRLSCTDRDTARNWVLSLAAAAAYFRGPATLAGGNSPSSRGSRATTLASSGGPPQVAAASSPAPVEPAAVTAGGGAADADVVGGEGEPQEEQAAAAASAAAPEEAPATVVASPATDDRSEAAPPVEREEAVEVAGAVPSAAAGAAAAAAPPSDEHAAHSALPSVLEGKLAVAAASLANLRTQGARIAEVVPARLTAAASASSSGLQQQLQAVLASPNIQALLANPKIQAILANPKLRSIVDDPRLQAAARPAASAAALLTMVAVLVAARRRAARRLLALR